MSYNSIIILLQKHLHLWTIRFQHPLGGKSPSTSQAVELSIFNFRGQGCEPRESPHSKPGEKDSVLKTSPNSGKLYSTLCNISLFVLIVKVLKKRFHRTSLNMTFRNLQGKQLKEACPHLSRGCINLQCKSQSPEANTTPIGEATTTCENTPESGISQFIFKVILRTSAALKTDDDRVPELC